jgi:hypothetical protein
MEFFSVKALPAVLYNLDELLSRWTGRNKKQPGGRITLRNENETMNKLEVSEYLKPNIKGMSSS